MEKHRLEEMMEFGDGFVLKRLADEPEAQINLVCLGPRQALPAHETNSNVRLLPLVGELTITIAGDQGRLKTHEMTAVKLGTPMQIANDTDANAAFLVIKTPNPSVL